ncbi:MAG TPA: NAD-dependent epimerase/dehydratase family protein [Pirellulaceae bacterium]|nr:NAD-dependent epimerase/dehydratase family protein [Pirellulaceae bacterium]
MKYLVTGATGLLGNNIVRQLLARGESVRVLSRATSDPRPLAGLDVQQATGDVCDAESVNAACADMDVVVHCAGHVHIGWSQQQQHEAINVGGTRNVAAAALQAGAKLVHVSSVNALGLGKLAQPADEDNPLPGIVACHYAVTKRRGDEIVLEAVARGLNAAIVHPGFMLGPWDWKPSSGRMLLEVAKFVPLAPIGAHSMCDVRDVAAGVIAAATVGRDSVASQADRRGASAYDETHRRGASAYDETHRRGSAAYAGRRYILAGHNITYLDSWKLMARLTGARPPLFPAGPINRWIGGWWGDSRFRRTGIEPELNSAAIGMSCQQHCFSSARAEQELGYKIRPLEESIEGAWQWFREHGYVKKG